MSMLQVGPGCGASQQAGVLGNATVQWQRVHADAGTQWRTDMMGRPKAGRAMRQPDRHGSS
jgi:hypothetical protein